GKIRREAIGGGGVMSSDIVRDRELSELITQLSSASEALFDTRGLLDDGDPDSVAIITMNNLDVGRAALDAATNYLVNLRAAHHAKVAAPADAVATSKHPRRPAPRPPPISPNAWRPILRPASPIWSGDTATTPRSRQQPGRNSCPPWRPGNGGDASVTAAKSRCARSERHAT